MATSYEDFLQSDFYKNLGKLPGGSNLQTGLRNSVMEGALQESYMQLIDPNSDYYKTLRSELEKSISEATPTLGTLIGAQRSAGTSYTSSQAIASEQRKAAERRGAETLARSVANAQLQGLAQGQQGLLGLAQLNEQRRQFDESQPSFGDQLLDIAGGLAGTLTGGLLGGSSPSRSSSYAPAQYTPNAQVGINRIQTNQYGFYDPNAIQQNQFYAPNSFSQMYRGY